MASFFQRLRELNRIQKQKALEKSVEKKSIPTGELALFTDQMASMLDAGLPLMACLEALQEQTANGYLAIIIQRLREDLSNGTPLSSAMRKFPRAFPPMMPSLIEAGEASGSLPSILKQLAVYLKNSAQLAKKVKSALTYPTVVISMAVILVSVMLIKIIPTFQEMFTGMGAELPLPTQIVIDLSEFLQNYVFYLIAAIVAFLYGWKRFIRTPKGKAFKDTLTLKLPIAGALSRKLNVARFCRTYASLTKNSVPVLRTITICAAASDNVFIERACEDMRESISQGGQLSDVLARTPYFPKVTSFMARSGERIGKTDTMLEKMADLYESEIDNTIQALSSLMEPLLIAFLGIVIGGIVLAMFMPIFQMSSLVAGG